MSAHSSLNMQLEAPSYLTADVPGIGGRLKMRPEDFLVEEIPLYEPSGQGDHVYILVEKRRRLTSDVTRILGNHLGVPQRQFGFAGLKDKQAITRQYVSIEHVDPDKLETFEDEHIKILSVDRHTNKLKRGHLKGNRFDIKLRGVDPTQAIHALNVLRTLEARGCPNFLGEQRFGYRMDNHRLGRCLILGDYQGYLDLLLGGSGEDEPEANQQARAAYEAGDFNAALEAWPTVHRFERQAVGPLSRGATPQQAVNGVDMTQRQLLVSAFQSLIFNRLLNYRMANDMFDRLVNGDVAMKHINRACFDVTDAEAEQHRVAAGEICSTGPMWGKDMRRASGEMDRMELEALKETGLDLADLQSGPYRPSGARRPNRMLVQHIDVSGGADEHGLYVRAAFDLPRGCFATIVMREIMKSPGFWGTEYIPDPADADQTSPVGDDAVDEEGSDE